MFLILILARAIGAPFVAFARARGRTKVIVAAIIVVLAVAGAISNANTSYPTEPTKQEQQQHEQDRRAADYWKQVGKPARHHCTKTEVTIKTTTGTHPSRTTTVKRECS